MLRALVDTYVQRARREPVDWTEVNNQKSALGIARLDPPQLAIIELDAQGGRLPFCEALRYRLPSLRVVAVGGTRPGPGSPCDQYLAVPLVAQEVETVLMAVLDGKTHDRLQRGPVRLNVDTRSVVTPKGQYHMTPKTTLLLQFLMQHHDEVLSRSQIMQSVWETTYLEDTRTLDVHIRWLREKLETHPSSPEHLITVRGFGYRFG